ncbi:MAG TPA: oligosaccharide flippase family protein [Solirubrobacteraceae bacterium]|jgi:O-antigen/teichoic acid export membrane protein|nr:oligosaccharide flippase family protein [Solirubrobacteraceae bacterium]
MTTSQPPDGGAVVGAAAAAEPVDRLSTPEAGPTAVRGGAMRVGGFVLASGLSILAAALLFRHLGHQDVGRYVTILALVAIVGGISDLGLTTLGIREMSVVAHSERAGLARDLLGLRMILSVLGLAGMFAFALLAYSVTVAAGVAIAGVGLLLQATQDNCGATLQVELRFGAVASLDVLRQLATAVLVALLVVLGAHLLVFVSVPIWVGAIVVVVAAWMLRGQRSLLPTFDRRRARRLVLLVLPFAAATIASALYPQEAVVLIGLISNNHQLSSYGIAVRVIQGIATVPALLIGTALPIFARAARDDQARFEYAIARVFEVATIAGAGTAVALAVGAPLAVKIIGGSSYHYANGVLALQGISFGISFVGSLWGNGLLSQGRYRALVVLNTAGAVGLAGLLAVLIPADGARGAAIAAAIVELALTITSCALVYRGRETRGPPLGVLPKTALAAGLALLPALWHQAPDIVRLLLAGVIFGATVLLTRAVPREMSALLPGRRS